MYLYKCIYIYYIYTNFECLLYEMLNTLFKFNETFFLKTFFLSFSNLHRTVTNKKYKKVYTNRITAICFPVS